MNDIQREEVTKERVNTNKSNIVSSEKKTVNILSGLQCGLLGWKQ